MDLSYLLNPETIVTTLGSLGVIAIIFLETGAFFGFFFPGDSLLFTAGLFASQGYLNFPLLLVGTFIAAVIGDNVGYGFGKKVGPSIFRKDDSFFFNKKNIIKAKNFYDKYGKKTIILARFVPIVRTFAPILAGVGGMHYKTFFTYNVVGGLIWTALNLTLGFVLGTVIPDAERFLLPIVAVIIFASFIPVGMEFWRNRKAFKGDKGGEIPTDISFK